MDNGRVPNRLAREASPYLQQHADNPVDWYPWGEEALTKARSEDKPIFLSIGYSACHWCHVMEAESFANPTIAELLNQHFISIKVDREERPDLDQLYQTACQLATGSGGWPLSVFLLPDQRPFYVGTYFPPTQRYGRPGFRQLLAAIAKAWAERRQELAAAAQRLTEAVGQAGGLPGGGGVPSSPLSEAVDWLLRHFDKTDGGFGGAPKFPQPALLHLLLRHHHIRGTGPRAKPSPSPLRRCDGAASMTSWGAVFTATASTKSGRCPTLKRCSTTMRPCHRSTSPPTS